MSGWLYQFKCKKCGKEIEQRVELGTMEVKCECGGEAKKILCPVAHQWVGRFTGFTWKN